MNEKQLKEYREFILDNLSKLFQNKDIKSLEIIEIIFKAK